jgi:UDP-2,3-diacylglucosamine pyrophosphatase LpxH
MSKKVIPTVWKTIILSDIHLGIRESKAEEVVKFLNTNTAETIILNGDIVDFWALKRGSKWKPKHSACMKKFFSLANKGVDVIWVRGNHDDFLDQFLPMESKFNGIKIVNDTEHIGINGKKYLVLHGDIFDIFITKMGWLAKIGSIGYDLALWFNHWYNEWRKYRNLPYLSVSKMIKDSVKQAVKFVTDFEDYITGTAKKSGYDGVICGHIHQPEIKMVDGIEYLNSGDWVENLTCLVEDFNGDWSIFTYKR